MAFDTRLYFNITSQSFIASVDQPSPINTPTWYADDTKHLLIQFVQSESAGAVSVVPGTGITLTVAIGAPGSSPTVDTSATAGAADATDTFTVDLPMNVAGVQTALGSSTSVQRTIEFRTVDGSGASQRYSAKINIAQRLITGTLVDVAPPLTALSGQEAIATLIPRNGAQSGYENTGFTMCDADDVTKVYIINIRGGVLRAEPLF